jgi:hypothetical protein
MLKRLFVGALAAWAGYALLFEMSQGVGAWDDRQSSVGAWGWRFESPETDALIRSVDVVREAVPPGSVIAFTAPDAPHGVEFEAWRWTAYLMPEYEVLPVNDPEVGSLAQYAIGYQREIHHPLAEPMLKLPDGWLYRVKRP